MIQKDIVKFLRKEFGHHEVTVFTASQKNKSGILDCEIAYKGQSFWVEIKIGNDKLSHLQAAFMARHWQRSVCFKLNVTNIEITRMDSEGYPKFNYFKDRESTLKSIDGLFINVFEELLNIK